MHKDTYFLDPKAALSVAKKQNKHEINGDIQVCYYHGEKMQSGLSNLIHLPMEKMFDELSSGKVKIPKTIDFSGVDLSEDIKEQIFDNIKKILVKADEIRALDTYFFDSREAFLVASKNNKSDINGNNLQVCYYHGEKIESNLNNLIHMPMERMLNDLEEGRYRIPSKISFQGVDIDDDSKATVTNKINQILDKARSLRLLKNNQYFENIKNAKLDFKQQLRFYMPAHVNTRVMQYVTKHISEALKREGYDVLYDLQFGMEDSQCLKTISQYNPHVTININHLNNTYLNKECFNFVWFQDTMPALTDDSKLHLRERDFVFHLAKGIGERIKQKSINSNHQSFCINEKIYFDKKNTRKRKIVFIGSSYRDKFLSKFNSNVFKDLVNDMIVLFKKDWIVDDDNIERLSQLYSVSNTDIHEVMGYIYRDVFLLEFVKLSTSFEFELYGYGWEYYNELKPFYKGVLKHGDEIADVYNMATYMLVPGGGYILQQRVLEAVFSGCIPLVFDNRYLSRIEGPFYEEALEYFKTHQDLEAILKKNELLDKDFSNILEKYKYSTFVNKIIDTIHTKVSI